MASPFTVITSSPVSPISSSVAVVIVAAQAGPDGHGPIDGQIGRQIRCAIGRQIGGQIRRVERRDDIHRRVHDLPGSDLEGDVAAGPVARLAAT